ncbi:MAG: ABC transporter substrate-binding protein [Spirochaetes bacterium]|nr:ABC transporter substrate-binding protein [Spirochaetota bacterium]MBU1079712.1 ABC transporter substrate-binding protein [Spirochaetota bacterium]
MQRIVSIALACLALASCGGGKEKAAEAPAAPETLMIYTSMKEVLIGQIKDAFVKKHPNVTVDYYSAGAGKVMAKMAAERQSGQIVADIIWTSEVPDFFSMKKEGLLEPYISPEAAHIVSPVEDAEGYYTAARLGTLGIVYNTDKVKTPPTSWNDLLKPEFKGAFAIANPALSGTAFVSIGMLVENFGWEFVEKLRANGAMMGKGSGQVIDDTASGDLSGCIGVDYITLDKVEKGATLGFAYPQEMLVIPSPVAILKGTKNQSAARKFVDFLLSAEGQSIIAGANTIPARADVAVKAGIGLVSADVAVGRALKVDYAKLGAEKEASIERFANIMTK